VHDVLHFLRTRLKDLGFCRIYQSCFALPSGKREYAEFCFFDMNRKVLGSFVDGQGTYEEVENFKLKPPSKKRNLHGPTGIIRLKLNYERGLITWRLPTYRSPEGQNKEQWVCQLPSKTGPIFMVYIPSELNASLGFV